MLVENSPATAAPGACLAESASVPAVLPASTFFLRPRSAPQSPGAASPVESRRTRTPISCRYPIGVSILVPRMFHKSCMLTRGRSVPRLDRRRRGARPKPPSAGAERGYDGGGGGIRTPGTREGPPVFETGAFDQALPPHRLAVRATSTAICPTAIYLTAPTLVPVRPARPPQKRRERTSCPLQLCRNERRHVVEDRAEFLRVSPSGRGERGTSAATSPKSLAQGGDERTRLEVAVSN